MPRHLARTHICDGCKHEISRHGLVDGGDTVAGPYACAECSCEIRQDAPMTAIPA